MNQETKIQHSGSISSFDDIQANSISIFKKIAENLPLTIFVLGPPCSGKSTTANLFCQLLQSRHFFSSNSNTLLINTGKLLRSFSSSSENADLLKSSILNKMRNGDLVSQASKIFVWYREINYFLGHSPNGSLIFDGSPRDENERRVLSELMIEIGRNPIFIEISIQEEELSKRLLLRNENRPDDVLETVKKRIQSYKDVTKIELNKMYGIFPVESLEVKMDEGEFNVLHRFIKRVNSGLFKLDKSRFKS